ncbi:MAG: PAS domain S-box protein [Bacteroidia bacterium]|nr:MAG: PAS domain S-box protein [Bacteroidia bacterium]
MRDVFFIKIIVPAILIIVLFVFSFYLIFLPMVERGFMDRKKEMIMELTNSALSVIDEYYLEIERQNLTEEMAKEMAINRIKYIRYGDEGKDYFWITNMVPEMIMHPFRTDLNGTDISDYTDPEGTRLFYEAVRKVKDNGEGYIDYYWQWKDDSTRIVPKLSFVKGFEPWGWIVGTGIYLEDVNEEIKAIGGRLVRITLVIILLIAIIVFYITRQSLIIENKRIDAEEELKQSQLKYKMLVEASSESTLMWLDGKLIYYNQPILRQTGYSGEELLKKRMDDLFTIQDESVAEFCDRVDQSRNAEAMLRTKSGKELGVVITISNIEISGKRGFIFIIKDVTRHLLRDKSEQMLEEELRTALTIMNSSVNLFLREPETIDMDVSIEDAGNLMMRKQADLLFVTKNTKDIVGVISGDAIIMDALSANTTQNRKVFSIMKSPVHFVDEKVLLFEALLLMEKEGVEYLAIKNENHQTISYITKKDLCEAQQNVSMLLVKRIEKAELIGQLQGLYDKLPGILSLLLSSDSHCRNVARISTVISDAIAIRVIELLIEKTGPPPVKFAFVALGSDGREEQTLKTDQDNAIIFQGQHTEEVHKYFLELAKKINKWLNEIGYEFCKGKVMAGNPKWCQPVSKWKEYFREWVEDSDPESILDTSIFFDMRFVYGDPSLVDELKDEIKKTTDAKAVFFSHIAQSVHRTKPVSFSEKQESIDIKRAMLPVVGFARVYALKNKLSETNTVYRLRGITASEKINPSFIEEIINAYEYLMYLRFRLQTQKIQNNDTPDNILHLAALSNIEKATLKAALNEITEIYAQLGFDFEANV